MPDFVVWLILRLHPDPNLFYAAELVDIVNTSLSFFSSCSDLIVRQRSSLQLRLCMGR